MRRILVLGLAALLVLGLVSAAAAHSFGPQGRGSFDHMGVMGGPAFGLDLTEDQLEQLAKLREEFFAAMLQLREQLFRVRYEYRQAILDNDQERLTALRQQLLELRQAMQDLRLQQREALLAVLTPEQREQLQEYWSEFCPMAGYGLSGMMDGFGFGGGMMGYHGGMMGMMGGFRGGMMGNFGGMMGNFGGMMGNMGFNLWGR